MVSQTTIVDQILDDSASNTYDNYAWITIGTGTQTISTGTKNINNPVSIASGTNNFNKIRESDFNSFLSGAEMVMLFKLLPGEPESQPINVGEMGLMKAATALSDSLGVAAKLNVAQTKDNTVQQRYRMTLRYARIGE